MKKLFTVCLLMFLVNTHVPTLDAATEEETRLHHLHALFTTLGIKVEKSYDAMNAYAQANWLRKPGQERWHMEPSQHQAKLKAITPHLTALGFIHEALPTQNKPTYALLLGATVFRMRTRLQYLFNLIEAHDFKPAKIVFLVGERPLDPAVEPEAMLLDPAYIQTSWKLSGKLPATEAEAAKFIWDQIPKPKSVAAIPVEFISTPMLTKNGKTVRPTTVDTVNTWLATHPKPGAIVAISNNPYVPYQNETINPVLINANWFNLGGSLETVGEAASETLDIASLLDNVARYIYSIIQTNAAKAKLTQKAA